MVNPSSKIRAALLSFIWACLVAYGIYHAISIRHSARLPFLLSSNGKISTLQLEIFNEKKTQIQTTDLILKLEGKAFRAKETLEFLKQHRSGDRLRLEVLRAGETIKVETVLSRFSQNTYLILFFIPLLLAVVFFGFALFMLAQKGIFRRARETVEVFSGICFGASVFFLILLPTTTLGLPFSFSILLPAFGISLVHLFAIYPKKKGSSALRYGFLIPAYAFAVIWGAARVYFWNRPDFTWVHEFNAWTLGGCFVFSLGCLGNTLLTSKDFWARRRARLLGTLYVFSFLAALSAFVAILWETPRISVERFLAACIVFPTAFAVVFLKSNVFDLERLFRRALHQFVLLTMAATFALLVGVGWSQWRIAPEDDWMLWVAIAIVVLAVARPVGQWVENAVHRMIQTRVRYPDISKIFEGSKDLETFLSALFKCYESDLNMKSISLSCFQNPTEAWCQTNQEVWALSEGRLIRVFEKTLPKHYEQVLVRADRSIGVLEFDGGDALAFDPKNSAEWTECVRQLTRCVELLVLQEYMAHQQGFLAVGRMQALLAHELKNPLAIVKVCAGLVSDRVKDKDDEVDELLRTIQSEIVRASKAVQRLFDQPPMEAIHKQRIVVPDLMEKIAEEVRTRFPTEDLEISLWDQGQAHPKNNSEEFFTIQADPEGFRQAVTNLIVNAFEAGSPFVHVQIHRLRNENIHVWVQDRGPGIPSHIDIFKPFVTTKPNGTGLGLAQVKAFADRNDAHIRVESAPGGGSIFALEFGPLLQ